MPSAVFSKRILKRFEIHERGHACAILKNDFPTEFSDLLSWLDSFQLLRSEIIHPGGQKTKIARRIETHFNALGWKEYSVPVRWSVAEDVRHMATHSIDLCKSRIACEIQWNSKDGVFSRDLTTLRLLHEVNVISAGIVITRADELQFLFDSLGWVRNAAEKWQNIGKKYGQSTTHMSKLKTRINNGDAGTCPMLSIGIKKECYLDDIPEVRILDGPLRA